MTAAVRLDASAQMCALHGWAVFPCTLDKRPLIDGGFHAATRDPEQIREWWRRWPNASIGAAIPDSLAVLDVDGETGKATLTDLEQAYEPLPATLLCRTGGGGLHFYWLHPGGELRQGAGILGPGLDTRMPRKGYVILPPSPHQAGRSYEWQDPAIRIASMPPWLAALLRPPQPVRSTPRVRAIGTAYVRAALAGEVAAVAGAPVGGRNNQLHMSAVKLGSLVGAGGLSESDAIAALLEGARACGYLDSDGERAARLTIQSGLSYGVAHPRERAR